MKYLIVTADDLGLEKSINEGIAQAHSEGIVTTLSVIPTGEAFEDALILIKRLGVKEISAHLSLTETVPIRDPGDASSLITSGNTFHKGHTSFFINFSLGRIRKEDVYNELKAQLNALKKTALTINCINSHEHIHMLPGVLSIFVRLAQEYGIPAIRYPHGDRPNRLMSAYELYRKGVLAYFARGMIKTLRNSQLRYTDHFFGFMDSGRLDEERLVAILASLPDGVTELVCHPGFLSPAVLERYPWHKNGEEELAALTSRCAKKTIEEHGIVLTTYQKFLAGKT